jgi:hypothetical protein
MSLYDTEFPVEVYSVRNSCVLVSINRVLLYIETKNLSVYILQEEEEEEEEDVKKKIMTIIILRVYIEFSW